MAIREYIQIVRRWWIVLLVAAVAGAAGGYFVSLRLPQAYEAEARLLVGPLNADFETIRSASQLTETYAAVVTSQTVLQGAITASESDLSVEELRPNVRTSASTVTRVITLRVQAPRPELAVALSESIIDELVELAGAANQRPEGQLQVVDAPTAADEAVSPQVVLIMGLSTLAALIAAFVVVLAVEYLREPLRRRDAALVDLPILGTAVIPPVAGGRNELAMPSLELALEGRYQELLSGLGSGDDLETGGWLLMIGLTPGDAEEAATRLADLLGRTERVALLAGGAGRLRAALVYKGKWSKVARPVDRAAEQLLARWRPERVFVGLPSEQARTWGRFAGSCDSTVIVVRRGDSDEAIVNLANRIRARGGRLLGMVLAEPSRFETDSRGTVVPAARDGGMSADLGGSPPVLPGQ